jgi:beta-glucosidase-like glycosyl hydrolase
MRAVGVHHGLAPVIDIARDPRWGRTEETFGEDPYLTSVMGAAYIRGLQGEDWTEGVMATAKHFVGYSASEGGLNWAPAHIPERELREVYLAPFEAAVRAPNLATIMPAYHELDGEPCSSSRRLMTEILRDEWGFDGLVVSDYMGINQLRNYHKLAQDKADAARLALEAGMDLELPSIDAYGQPLLDAVKAGEIPLALIDRSVRRMLALKFAFGLFEHPYVDPDAVLAVFDTPAQRALAREIARKSMVLLKNEGDLLPLRQDADFDRRDRPERRRHAQPAGRLLLPGAHRDADRAARAGFLRASAAGVDQAGRRLRRHDQRADGDPRRRVSADTGALRQRLRREQRLDRMALPQPSTPRAKPKSPSSSWATRPASRRSAPPASSATART